MSKVPTSRLNRLSRLVGLTGKVGTNLVARTASRLAGGDGRWAERRAARQLVATLGQMKGLAQKVGQLISMDVDHLPPEVREIVSALQGKSKPVDYRAMAGVVEAELGLPPERLYAHFDPIPFAAASLGQVHRAQLADGRQVAVKIQYPGITEALTADLANLDTLLKAVGTVVGRAFQGRGYYHELHSELERETDYRLEAENARRFAVWLRPFPEIVVPEVVAELSTGRVLTLEYLPGEPLSELLKRGPSVDNARRFQISAQLIAALFGPALSQGVVHADPHPGNFHLLPDGRLGLLDFGAVKQLPANIAEANRDLYRAILVGVSPDPVDLLERAGFEVGAPPDEIRALWPVLFQILRQPSQTDRYDFSESRLVTDFRSFALAHVKTLIQIRPPADGVMFFRAVGGQAQNLRALGATGNFREVHQRVIRLSTGEEDRLVSSAG